MLPLHPDYLPIRADEITPARLQLYEAFTGNIGTTIRAEYLPRTTMPRPYTGPLLIEPSVVPLRRSYRAVKRRPRSWNGTPHGKCGRRKSTLITRRWPCRCCIGRAGRQRSTGKRPRSALRPILGYIQIDVPHGVHQLDFRIRPNAAARRSPN